MNKKQIDSMQNREMSKLLDLIVFIHLDGDINDFGINENGDTYFDFKTNNSMVYFVTYFNMMVNNFLPYPYCLCSNKNCVTFSLPDYEQ